MILAAATSFQITNCVTFRQFLLVFFVSSMCFVSLLAFIIFFRSVFALFTFFSCLCCRLLFHFSRWNCEQTKRGPQKSKQIDFVDDSIFAKNSFSKLSEEKRAPGRCTANFFFVFCFRYRFVFTVIRIMAF